MNDEYFGFVASTAIFSLATSQDIYRKNSAKKKDLTHLETNIFASENGWLENGWLEYC